MAHRRHITDDEVHIYYGFHPPIRKDRKSGDHGGIAIYVKDNLICKPRYDLFIPQLGAIWIETKLAQETILIGSFCRPPSSHVEYWRLINESITDVVSTPYKFIILGDLNSDFIHNASTHHSSGHRHGGLVAKASAS